MYTLQIKMFKLLQYIKHYWQNNLVNTHQQGKVIYLAKTKMIIFWNGKNDLVICKDTAGKKNEQNLLFEYKLCNYLGLYSQKVLRLKVSPSAEFCEQFLKIRGMSLLILGTVHF